MKRGQKAEREDKKYEEESGELERTGCMQRRQDACREDRKHKERTGGTKKGQEVGRKERKN